MPSIPEDVLSRIEELKAMGFDNLTGPDKAQYLSLKNEYPDLFDSDGAVPTVEVRQPATPREAPKGKRKEVLPGQPEDKDFNKKIEYVFQENVLHNGHHYTKGDMITGDLKGAKDLYRRSLIIKK